MAERPTPSMVGGQADASAVPARSRHSRPTDEELVIARDNARLLAARPAASARE
jgi:hypothetical protein